VTPDECVALAHETQRVILHPLMAGSMRSSAGRAYGSSCASPAEDPSRRMSDLEQRIRVLEDLEAIKRLKYRYCGIST